MNSKIVEIKKAKNGRGLFAKIILNKGEKIFQVKGFLIPESKFMKFSKKIRNNTFRFDSDKYISPKGKIGNFINHSCNPNSKVTKIKNKLFVVAIKKIKPNEEILFDYSTNTADDDFWKMKCNCGSKKCRKVISKFSELPKNLQKKYIKSKIVPDFIREIRF